MKIIANLILKMAKKCWKKVIKMKNNVILILKMANNVIKMKIIANLIFKMAKNVSKMQ